MSQPQTSCHYASCPKNHGFVEPDKPWEKTSSLALPNCSVPSGFACSNRQVYYQDVQPKPDNMKYTPLNPLGMRLSQCYTKLQNPVQGCSSVGYVGSNPLLISAPRGEKLVLDRPNYTGEVCVGNVPHDEIYTPQFANYGKHYTDIASIDGGQIQYYIGSLPNAYSEPNFVTPANVTHEVVRDPMGVYRPQYNRQSLQTYSWDACRQDECDSFTHDSLEFRQELMEKQMRKRNEQSWDSRWVKDSF